MKTQNIVLSLAAAALLVWTTGCEKKEATVQEQMKDTAGQAGDTIKKTTEAVKETGAKVVSDVTEKAKEVAAPAQEAAANASSKAQELIDSAKGLVGEGKFQDALAKLKELAGEKLSTEQQTMVDSLKAQIQKALVAAPKTPTDAAGAVGGLLKK